MITKGIIKTINYSNNTCRVRLPLFENVATSGEVVMEAIFSTQPGSYNGYAEEDVVFVDFENGQLDNPIIIGKLFLGANNETKEGKKGGLSIDSLNVARNASLPIDTKLVLDNTNTAVPVDNGVTSYKSILDIVRAINKTEQEVGKVSEVNLEAVASLKVEYVSIGINEADPTESHAGWQVATPEYQDGYNIWQKTTYFNHRGQILNAEIICLSEIASTATYRIRCSTRIHSGTQQKENLEIRAMVKFGSELETLDSDVNTKIEYKWGSSGTTIVGDNTIIIDANNVQDKDLIITYKRSGTVCDTDTIMFSPMNTPILDITKNSAAITYDKYGTKIGTDTVSSTGRLFLNSGVIDSEVLWILNNCTAAEAISNKWSEISTATKKVISNNTVTITDLSDNSAVATCWAFRKYYNPEIIVYRNNFTEANWATYGALGHYENWTNSPEVAPEVDPNTGIIIKEKYFVVIGKSSDENKNHVLWYKAIVNDIHTTSYGICVGHETFYEKELTLTKQIKGDSGINAVTQNAYYAVNDYATSIPEGPSDTLEAVTVNSFSSLNTWYTFKDSNDAFLNIPGDTMPSEWKLCFISRRSGTEDEGVYTWGKWETPTMYKVADEEAYQIIKTSQGLFGYDGTNQGVFYTVKESVNTGGYKFDAGKPYTPEELSKYASESIENQKNVKIYINAEYINTGVLTVKKKIDNEQKTIFSAGLVNGDVTIGGFTVTNNSIYNKKSSLTENKDGVYIGTDGIALGNAFSVDTTGHVTATSITLQSDQIDGLDTKLTSMEQATADAQSTANSAINDAAAALTNAKSYADDKKAEAIKDAADAAAALYQTEADVQTITRTVITDEEITAPKLKVEAANIQGQLTADKIVSGVVAAGSLVVKDKFSAVVDGDVTICGFNVSEDTISNGTIGTNNSVAISTGTSDSADIGGSGSLANWNFTAGTNFGVRTNSSGVSELYASKGKIGGFTIDSNSISYGTLGSSGLYLGNGTTTSLNIAGSGSKTNWRLVAGNSFGVDNNGNLYASGGKIGDFNITGGALNVSSGTWHSTSGNYKKTELAAGSLTIAGCESVSTGFSTREQNNYYIEASSKGLSSSKLYRTFSTNKGWTEREYVSVPGFRQSDAAVEWDKSKGDWKVYPATIILYKTVVVSTKVTESNGWLAADTVYYRGTWKPSDEFSLVKKIITFQTTVVGSEAEPPTISTSSDGTTITITSTSDCSVMVWAVCYAASSPK